jgi:pSer/pThr/pTyr-binding forkhead associated (FHA) protein
MGQLLFRTLIGLLAGLAAWAIREPFMPGLGPRYGAWEFSFILSIGAIVGGAIGCLNGFLRGGKVHTVRGLGLGILFGSLGIMIGYSFGGQLANSLSGGIPIVDVAMPFRILVRAAAIAPMSITLGAGIGAASLSPRSIRNGAIGGFSAGVTSGVLFDVLGSALSGLFSQLQNSPGQLSEVGALPRAMTAVLMGGMIALFIGIVERLARTAWLRLRLGKNEGKEWVVDMPQTFIGRSERAHVPLFGDPTIAPMHACIVKNGGAYMLMDSGGGTGTRLNGYPIQQAPLTSGDAITVGQTTLEFVTRAGAAPVRGPEQYIGQAYPLQGGGQTAPVAPVPISPYTPHQTPAPIPTPLQNQMPTMMAPMTPAAGYTLVALDGPLSGKRYPLTGPIDVGRESTVIPLGFDNMASRRHARLEPASMGVQVTDLNSTNGTYVNGNRTASHVLNPGDMVRIGSTTFRLESA